MRRAFGSISELQFHSRSSRPPTRVALCPLTKIPVPPTRRISKKVLDQSQGFWWSAPALTGALTMLSLPAGPCVCASLAASSLRIASFSVAACCSAEETTRRKAPRRGVSVPWQAASCPRLGPRSSAGCPGSRPRKEALHLLRNGKEAQTKALRSALLRTSTS